jgi:hypothetical protein
LPALTTLAGGYSVFERNARPFSPSRLQPATVGR